MDGLQIGRIVHYVAPDGDQTKHLPAIVTAVVDARRGLVNLHVFHDDYRTLWFAEVPYAVGEVELTATWHWPERHVADHAGLI